MDENITLGSRLRKAREYANLKQNEAAGSLGVHKSTLNKYENDVNEPASGMLFRMSELYSVTVDYLVSGRLPSGIITGQYEINIESGDIVEEDPIIKMREWKFAHDNAYYHIRKLLYNLSTSDLHGLSNLNISDLSLIARATFDRDYFDEIMELFKHRYSTDIERRITELLERFKDGNI